jgi:hypothetical protein
MAKGQKRSNREQKKKKQPKPTVTAAGASFIAPAKAGAAMPGKKR